MRKILAVRLDNIGDLVMLTPALRALRRAAPEAWITLMASPAGAPIAPIMPAVNEVRVVRAFWQQVTPDPAFSPAKEQSLIEDLRAGAYDAALIFTSFSQSPY